MAERESLAAKAMNAIFYRHYMNGMDGVLAGKRMIQNIPEGSSFVIPCTIWADLETRPHPDTKVPTVYVTMYHIQRRSYHRTYKTFRGFDKAMRRETFRCCGDEGWKEESDARSQAQSV
jgi:hypothetical protein